MWVHTLDPEPTGPSPEPSPTQVAALETKNAELLVEQARLATERDILREAAKYFAGRRTGEPFPVRR